MRPTTEATAEIEFQVLSTPEGQALLDEVSKIVAPGPREISRWRKRFAAETVHAAIALGEARRRGVAKFARGDRMWFDRLGLEQSTSEVVARHKAARFAGSDVIDLCCGIGGDAIAIAGQARSVVAVDRDHGMLRRTLWNAEVYDVRPKILGVQARAEETPLPAQSLVHVDPDRRALREKRSHAITSYVPDVAFLRLLPDRCRGGAVKLSPASDFETLLEHRPHEVEMVSLGGECKEATVWFGELATCARRATTLPSGETWTDQSGTGHPTIATLSSWVFDPDPALGRAGLLDGFAAGWGLSRFEPGIDLFTSARLVETPWVAAFAVIDVVPLDLKALRAAARTHDLGTLEIKPRGVDTSPEALRKQIGANGSKSGTIFPVRGRDRSLAILARREPRTG